MIMTMSNNDNRCLIKTLFSFANHDINDNDDDDNADDDCGGDNDTDIKP